MRTGRSHGQRRRRRLPAGRGARPRTSLLDDLPAFATWEALSPRGSGYRADFTGASLADVEQFMAAHGDHGTAVAGGRLVDRPGA
ncbi:hypothetical protein ACIP98_12430 [Streptomyces sp. NPDC088354]|uniref:hypothetical protein n=1 Tax=Streptomyces sp. NPDC088354 TaxID=3365856 RepID=UPI0037F5CDBC